MYFTTSRRVTPVPHKKSNEMEDDRPRAHTDATSPEHIAPNLWHSSLPPVAVHGCFPFPVRRYVVVSTVGIELSCRVCSDRKENASPSSVTPSLFHPPCIHEARIRAMRFSLDFAILRGEKFFRINNRERNVFRNTSQNATKSWELR